MSLWIDQAINCSQCRRESSCRIWRSLNVQLDPQARQDLLDGKLMVFTCPFCGTSMPLLYNLLYHDMDQRVMVQLVSDGSTPEDLVMPPGFVIDMDIKSYCYRVVDTVLQLVEKILVFDANADDRVMEVFKAYMQHTDRKGQYPPGCTTMFDGVRQGKKAPEVVLLAIAEQYSRIYYPARKYDAVHHNSISLIDLEQNRGGPHPMWRRIDSAYARKLLHYDE